MPAISGSAAQEFDIFAQMEIITKASAFLPDRARRDQTNAGTGAQSTLPQPEEHVETEIRRANCSAFARHKPRAGHAKRPALIAAPHIPHEMGAGMVVGIHENQQFALRHARTGVALSRRAAFTCQTKYLGEVLNDFRRAIFGSAVNDNDLQSVISLLAQRLEKKADACAFVERGDDDSNRESRSRLGFTTCRGQAKHGRNGL